MNAGPVVGIGIPIIGDLFSAVAGVFTDVAGWAIDSVIAAITSWVIAGVLAVIEAIWSVIDATAQPAPTADWFSGGGSSPFQLAVGIGAAMLSLTLMAAVVRAVLAGSPGGITKAVGRDLPAAVFTMLATILFTQAALDLTDEISNWVWAGTRDDAARALEAISQILVAGMPASHFLGIVVAVGLLLSMLFLWVVLFVRESLIYLVIVFSAAFAWPMMVFPPLRDTARKAGELLLALIICKPVITLALSVGVSALAGIGGTGTPGDGAGTNLAREVGTLVVGVITFGLAAFMPFLCWKLMPLVAAAVVAQGVASAPMRAAQSGMQLQYYTTSTMQRLASGGRVPGVQPATTAAAPAAMAAGRPAATSTAAAAAAGAPVAAVAAPAVATARTVSTAAQATVDGATPTPRSPAAAAASTGPAGD